MATFPTYQELEGGFKIAGYELQIIDTGGDIVSAELGRGEQGRVFRAVKSSIKKQFAIKVVVPKDNEFSEEEKKSFRREVYCMAKIGRIPYVVSVLDQFQIKDKALCYVMDYIQAPDLSELIAAGELEGKRGGDNLIDILWQVAKGLYTIHEQKVIHRDIKESNILVQDDTLGGYHAIITDFGFGLDFERRSSFPYSLPAPVKDSSHTVGAQESSLPEEAYDYYSFAETIRACSRKSKKFKTHKLHDPLLAVAAYITDIAHKIKSMDETKGYDTIIIQKLGDLRRRASGIYRVDPEYASLLSVPELTDVGDGQVVRLAGEMTVPLTNRVLNIIDSAPFQRLRSIAQLSNVQLVYPGATHSRFEHSIGVFNIARLVLRHLLQAQAFTSSLDRSGVSKMLLAALLHDIGHVPFGHALEEIGLYDHEKAAERIILESDLSRLIKEDWNIEPQQVIDLIRMREHENLTDQVLKSILSQALDIDMMDYLMRDGIHIGVPYGQHFDMYRLIFSFKINDKGNSLAISHKGIVPAETFLIARYAMITEVYLHHTVRAATAQIQRAIYETRKTLTGYDLNTFDKVLTNCSLNETSFYSHIAGGGGSVGHKIIGKLAVHQRALYKRLFRIPEDILRNMLAFSFEKRVNVAKHFTKRIAERRNVKALEDWQILLDLPFDKYQKVNIQVFDDKQGTFENIENRSPLVRVLGEEFQKNTRKAHIFVDAKETVDKILSSATMDDLYNDLKLAIQEAENKTDH